MGNSPSFGLRSGSTHSSRDVRTTDPEMEVKRPPASQKPTQNVYEQLPASSKPHIISHISRPFHPNFGGVPFGPDRSCWGQLLLERKLIGREIIFEVFQLM